MFDSIRQRKQVRFAAQWAIFLAVVGVASYLYVLRLARTRQLVYAVEQNDTVAAVHLLAAGADPNRRSPFNDDESGMRNVVGGFDRKRTLGPPLLLKAATAGNDRLVHEFLARGADVNACDSFGTTPLMAAACSGNVQAVSDLLQHGADVNAADKNGRTALIFAARFQRAQMIPLLLSHGARGNAQAKSGDTPLTEAVRSGNVPVLKALIAAGAHTNVQLRDGQTPILLAESANNTAMMRLLLDLGLSPNAADRDGQTPLLYAAKFRNEEAISLLLKHGADPNQADKSGTTPLKRLFDPDHSVTGVTPIPAIQPFPIPLSTIQSLQRCFKLLMAHGADINRRAANGGTPLLSAAETADAGTFDMLFKAGARVTPGTKEMADLIRAAENARSADNLNVIFTRYPTADLRCDFSALFNAVAKPWILEWLLDHGVKANTKYTYGVPGKAGYSEWTALFSAVNEGQPESVRLLLTHGADVNATSISIIAGPNGSTTTQKSTVWSDAQTSQLLTNDPKVRSSIIAMLQAARSRHRSGK